MKRIAYLLAMVLLAGSAVAQVVRVEPASFSQTFLGSRGVVERIIYHIDPIRPQSTASSFDIRFDSIETPLEKGNSVALTGHMTNLLIAPVDIKFYRYHVHIPATWTSSICFGDNCYAPRTDSFATTTQPYSLPPGGTGGEFRLSMYCPANYTMSDSIVDYVKFVAVGGDDGDTIGVLLRGYLLIDGVEQSGAASVGGPRITSLFPSPLLSGNSIRLNINVPREMGFNYAIFDEMGRKVAFGTSRQHLLAGDNICEIGELNGYANGNYTVKFNFADGSSASRMFQIMR